MTSRDFFVRHGTFFNVSGWLMALGFGLLSIYFYKASVKIGEISYLTTTTKIFDSRISTPDIVVTRGPGGSQIKTDVYATEVVFWNSGDLRADTEDFDDVRDCGGVDRRQQGKVFFGQHEIPP